MQKSRDHSPICIARFSKGGEQEAWTGWYTLRTGEYRQRYREKREREREREIEREGEKGGGETEKTRRLLENERSKYGTGTYVYILRRRSAGGATGASKNVLRTLDITGSNVTRSRRELGSAFRGAERSEGSETRTAARRCRYPDDTVSRLLTITIDLALFYARAAYYSNLFKSMPPRAIGRKGRPSIGLRLAAM